MDLNAIPGTISLDNVLDSSRTVFAPRVKLLFSCENVTLFAYGAVETSLRLPPSRGFWILKDLLNLPVTRGTRLASTGKNSRRRPSATRSIARRRTRPDVTAWMCARRRSPPVVSLETRMKVL